MKTTNQTPEMNCHPAPPLDDSRQPVARRGWPHRSTLKQSLRLLIFSLALPLMLARADMILQIGDGIIATSLVRVVASPEQYAGKRIMLKGYYLQSSECSGLFLSKDDARIFNGQQGLWVGAVKEGLKVNFPRKGFVIITGTFRYTKDQGAGHMGEFLGELVDVEAIRMLK